MTRVTFEPAQIADPYSTAACPPTSQPWPEGSIPDLDQITAVRMCSRPGGQGFPTVIEGPADALVVHLGTLAAGIRALPDADPGRCAATDPIPLDNQLLLQAADGTTVSVPTGMCDDVQVEGRTVTGEDVSRLLIQGLRVQRDEHDYAATGVVAPEDCATGGYSPAQPSSEHLVAGITCTNGEVTAVLDPEAVALLDQAWRAAEPRGNDCLDSVVGGQMVVARTDRGDTVTLYPYGCDLLEYSASHDLRTYQVEFSTEDGG